MLLVYASFSLRRRIGTRNWRRLHWATYAIFAAATVHGIAAGTDTTQPWAFSLYLSAIALVVAATAWRALMPPAAATRGSGHDRPTPMSTLRIGLVLVLAVVAAVVANVVLLNVAPGRTTPWAS